MGAAAPIIPLIAAVAPAVIGSMSSKPEPVADSSPTPEAPNVPDPSVAENTAQAVASSEGDRLRALKRRQSASQRRLISLDDNSATLNSPTLLGE